MKLFFLLLFVLCFIDKFNTVSADCDCEHHVGGCVIKIPAIKGQKCRCSYKGFWTCAGFSLPCVTGDHCPGGADDYCACKLGGGDCGAYPDVDRRQDCSKAHLRPQITHVAIPNADCDCSYHPGGCSILKPAPKGYKCKCSYEGFWTCSGWPNPCRNTENCPGNEYSYCACKQGGGDCGAYPNSDRGEKCDYSVPKPPSCDCNKKSQWTGSSDYYISKVEYDSSKLQRSNVRPEVVGTKEILNDSFGEQTVQFVVTRGISSSSSFTRTAGIEIAINMEFSSGPPTGKVTQGFSVAGSTTYAWGKSKTNTVEFSNRFTCNGPARQHTMCTVSVQRATATVPYTMTTVHKKIPNCRCTSKGLWSGVDAYDATLGATHVGSCLKTGC